jgi:hypothetical protein
VDAPSGAEILQEAFGLVTGARQEAYDHPAKDYAQTCEIFTALTGIELTVEQALLFMVAVKLSRLRTNLERGVLHHDSLVDTLGYLACINMARGGTHEQVQDGNPVLPTDLPGRQAAGDQAGA